LRTLLATACLLLASSPAFAQATNTAAPGAGGAMDMQALLLQFGPLVLLFVLFYVMIIRPQQRRQREHQQAVQAVKRGDTIVMSSGMIGKVMRVEDTEVGVEIAQGVTVKVVKSMIADVRTRGEPAAANDAKG
jgi:preprotein translocase subunit YajC